MEKKNQDQASGSGDVAGWARVPGRCGWKPTIGMYCLGIVTSVLSVQFIY